MAENAIATTMCHEQQPEGTSGRRDRICRPVVLYSATCRFCRWVARTIATLDRHERLALLPLAASEAAHLLAGVPETKRAESWWLVRRDGMAVAGKNGAAVLLLAELHLTSPMARVFVRTGLSPLLDRLDALIAHHRRAMSRFVPDGPAPRRFP